MFWQETSSKLIWIFALTCKFKNKYLNLCFDKENQSDQYLQVTYHIFSNQICFLTEKIQKIELNFVFWQVKSSKFMVPPKELSTWGIQLRSPNEVCKLRPGWSLFGALLGVCWVSVGSLNCGIHQLPRQSVSYTHLTLPTKRIV